MQLKKTTGNDKDFFKLCQKLEDFQFNLMPVLNEKGYSLTDDLNEIVGYILYVDNEPVGSIGLKKIDSETCEIVRVFVCEEYRGKGFASLLFEKIETLAKELGYKKAEMVAWCKAKSALKLYNKLNYLVSKPKNSEWFDGLQYVEIFKNL